MYFEAKTGTRVTISLWNIELYEYPNISSSCFINDEKCLPDDFDLFLQSDHPYFGVAEKHAPVLVDGKWVYIFRETESRISLFYELKVGAGSGKQSYEYVSWKNKDIEKNRNTFPRPLSGKLNDVLIETDKEYYILLSQIQLPMHRLDFYIQNQHQLAYRAFNVRPGSIGSGNPAKIYLIDFKEISSAMNEERNEAVEKYNDYFSNADENTKRYLAEMVTAIKKNSPEIDKWLDFTACSEYRAKEEETINDLVQVKDGAIGRLKDWKLLTGYTLTRDDYSGTKEYEEEILRHEAEVTTFDEFEYLAATGNDNRSWFERLFSGDSPFLFHRKLTTLSSSDDLAEVLSKHVISKFLAQFPKTAPAAVYKPETVHKIQVKVIQEFEEIIQRHGITLPGLPKTKNGAHFYIDAKIKVPKISYKLESVPTTRMTFDYFDTSAYDKAMDDWKKGVEKVSGSWKRILLGIEIINFFSSAKAVVSADTKSDKLFTGIVAIGSFTDAVSATDFLLKKRIEAKFEESLALKGFAAINLIGSICDYIGALKNTYEAGSNSNSGLAYSYATLGFAATAGMTSSVLTLSGGAGAAAFGISATGWGAIAVGLALLGASLVWIFTEKEIETWAKESEWGHDKSKRKSLPSQASNLHQILAKFKCECYILRQIKGTYATAHGTLKDYFYSLSFKITPGLWNMHKSRFRVSLKVVKNNIPFFTESTVINTTLTLPDDKTNHFPATNTHPAALIRCIRQNEMNNIPDMKYDKLSYSYTIQLDLKGNGSEMVPKKPIEENGTVQLQDFDFT